MNTAAIVSDVAAEAISRQSFYRRYANTINATSTALVGALAALLALWQGNGQNEAVVAVLVIAVPILTGIVTKLTRNGVSPSIQEALESTAVRAERINAEPVMEPVTIQEVETESVTVTEGTDLPVYDWDVKPVLFHAIDTKVDDSEAGSSPWCAGGK